MGVDEGKENIWYNLKIEFPGAGYCHFPIEVEKGYDEQYFKGLTSEKRVLTHEKGKPVLRWKRKLGSTKRNEPLDLRNYAAAGLEIFKINLDRLARLRKGNVYSEKNILCEKSTPITDGRKPKRRRIVSRGISL